MKLLLAVLFLTSCVSDQKLTDHGRRMYAKGVRNECHQNGGERDVCGEKFNKAIESFKLEGDTK